MKNKKLVLLGILAMVCTVSITYKEPDTEITHTKESLDKAKKEFSKAMQVLGANTSSDALYSALADNLNVFAVANLMEQSIMALDKYDSLSQAFEEKVKRPYQNEIFKILRKILKK